MDSDFLLTDGDIAFSPDGDIATVSGAALVAQDVRTRALASRGSLFYARGYGQGLTDMLRGNNGDVVQRLREAALGDERVDWESVEAGAYNEGKYYLKFQVLGAKDAQTLLVGAAPLAGAAPLGGGAS